MNNSKQFYQDLLDEWETDDECDDECEDQDQDEDQDYDYAEAAAGGDSLGSAKNYDADYTIIHVLVDGKEETTFTFSKDAQTSFNTTIPNVGVLIFSNVPAKY